VLANIIHAYQERTNAKVDQLALAHTSIINAVVALVVAICLLAVLVVFEALKGHS
jgi:uncharacterized membrane protein